VSGTTGSNGTVVLESNRLRTNNPLSYEFCVDDVTHASLDYDSADNAATCFSE
jgi:hypothetical protein